jgi:GH24 family phage-related lysozyme (muramidase)
MKLSQAGIDLVKSFEGFRSCPYRDAVGVWTIGCGSTKDVGPNTKCVSRKQAEDRLRAEVDATYGAAVDKIVGLSQHQHDALASFVCNLGPGGILSPPASATPSEPSSRTRRPNELLSLDLDHMDVVVRPDC